jgi:hypothetical protein
MQEMGGFHLIFFCGAQGVNTAQTKANMTGDNEIQDRINAEKYEQVV